jgi:hypothetical protein
VYALEGSLEVTVEPHARAPRVGRARVASALDDVRPAGEPTGRYRPTWTTPPADALAPATVFDTVYRPLETRLLREARARGCRIQDCLDMLVHQAVEQIRIWSGKSADPLLLRRAALEELAKP